jgi:uncharacterized protein YndB with AHSA1/START domain
VSKEETEEITISRVFDAPPELVYRAFVDPDQLCLWFGPLGYSVPCETVQIDARPGGFQRFIIINDDDPAQRSPVETTLTEVVENKLLVSHDEITGIPGTAGTTSYRLRLEFHEENGGHQTRLELRQGPFAGNMGSEAKTGWEGSFTKLDSLLRRSL